MYCVWQVVKTLTVILNNPVLCTCERSVSLYSLGKGFPGTPWIRRWVNPRPSTSSGVRKNVLILAGNNPLIPSFHPLYGTILTVIRVHCLYFYIRIKVWIVGVVWMPANERGCCLDHSYWSAQLGCCIQRLRKLSGSDKLEVRIAGTKLYGVKREALWIKHVQSGAKMCPDYSGPSRDLPTRLIPSCQIPALTSALRSLLLKIRVPFTNRI